MAARVGRQQHMKTCEPRREARVPFGHILPAIEPGGRMTVNPRVSDDMAAAQRFDLLFREAQPSEVYLGVVLA